MQQRSLAGATGVAWVLVMLVGSWGCDSEGAGDGPSGSGGTGLGSSAVGGSSVGGGDAGASVGGSAGAGGSGGSPGVGAGGSGGEGSGGEGASGPVVFEEIDGLVAVEAEHFDVNDDNGTLRSWTLTENGSDPGVTPDPDPPHSDTASGAANLEGLPDTRVTHDDQLISGENFFGEPGDGPTLSYRVHFNNPGTYYVWVRAHSTGTEDNGVHVGIDGTWPASGEKLQFCSGKNQWTWSSAQRDSGGSACGVANTITLEVDSAGEHVITFSMREDGFEIDKWIMTDDVEFEPEGAGPAEKIVGQD